MAGAVGQPPTPPPPLFSFSLSHLTHVYLSPPSPFLSPPYLPLPPLWHEGVEGPGVSDRGLRAGLHLACPLRGNKCSV